MADEVVGRGVIELVADARRLKAGIEEAKRATRTLGEGQKEISRAAQRSIDQYIGRLQVQNQTLGKSVRETELFKLAVRGASNEQLKLADAALKGIEAQKRAITEAAARQEQMAAVISKVRFAAIALGTAVATGLFAFAKSAISTAAELDDLAEKTGASVENLSKLSQQAFISGTDMGTVEQALVRLTKGLHGTDEESGEAARALRALGLSADQLKTKDTAEALQLVAQRMNEFADGSGKTAVALALFGKSGAQVLPFLKDLANDQSLAARVTAEQAAKAEELEKAFRRLTNEAREAGKAMALDLVPSMLRFIQAVNDANRLNLDFGTKLRFANPFTSVNEALTLTRKELDEAIKKKNEFFSRTGVNTQAQIDEVTKLQTRLEFFKGLQARDALASAGGDTPGERQRFGLAGSVRGQLPFESASKKVSDAADTLRAERAAQLAFDLAEIKKASDAQLNTFANAQRILQAMKAADLVQDRDYYAAKLGFIQLNAREQEAALEKEIARLQQETFVGKTATKDRIDNERKIADAQARLSKVREDSAANARVNSIEEEAANRRIAQSYADASAAAQFYIDTVKRQNARELAGIGQGRRFREDQAGLNEIEDRLLQARQKLEGELRRNQITRDQFDAYIKIAEDTYQREIDLYVERTDAIRKAQGDWLNGASEALNNYIEETRDIAKQTEDLFTDAFKGAEDALVEFVKTGKLDFGSLIDQIHTDLLRISIRQSITGPLAEILLGTRQTPGVQGPTQTGGNLTDPLEGNILAQIARIFIPGGGIGGVLGGVLGGGGAGGAAGANASLVTLSATSATTSAALAAMTAAASAAAAALTTVAATSGVSGASGFADIGFDIADVFGSFATGTSYVPRTGPYMLHEGERVVTRADNMRGGGRPVTVINNFPPGTNRQTVSQAATATGRAVNRELARNG